MCCSRSAARLRRNNRLQAFNGTQTLSLSLDQSRQSLFKLQGFGEAINCSEIRVFNKFVRPLEIFARFRDRGSRCGFADCGINFLY